MSCYVEWQKFLIQKITSYDCIAIYTPSILPSRSRVPPSFTQGGLYSLFKITFPIISNFNFQIKKRIFTAEKRGFRGTPYPTIYTTTYPQFWKYLSIIGNFDFRLENTRIKKQKEKSQNYRKGQMQKLSSIMHLPFSEDKGRKSPLRSVR